MKLESLHLLNSSSISNIAKHLKVSRYKAKQLILSNPKNKAAALEVLSDKRVHSIDLFDPIASAIEEIILRRPHFVMSAAQIREQVKLFYPELPLVSVSTLRKIMR